MRREARQVWEDELPSELAFWREWIRTRGGEWPDDFERRLDPHAVIFDEGLSKYLNRVPSDVLRVLDVGAGPLTVLGKTLPGRRLEICAVDALADEYNRMLNDAGITPPVRTVQCDAEAVDERFPAGSFDIAHARNCLDHAFDPVRAIEAMFAVVRTGGYVLLRHERNVGAGTEYDGLHQWNFDMVAGDLVIWRGEFIRRVGHHLGAAAEVEVTTWRADGGRDYVDCAIRKIRQ